MMMREDPQNTEMWRRALNGTEPMLLRWRRIAKRIPSEPRCKMCATPFGGVGRVGARLIGHDPSPRNPLLCKACKGSLLKHPGGAQIDVGVLFADVRGSTHLAEGIDAVEFRNLLQGFYAAAHEAITAMDGIVDKFLGDGVMALFIPAFAGEGFVGRAIEAGQALLRAVAGAPGRRLPVGVGVHSGMAYVGVVGSGDESDFSALGDVVNVAARLGSQAAAGELLVSADAARAGGLAIDPQTLTTVEIAGREQPLDIIRFQVAEV
jgi:adenylate cyclase